MRAPQNNSGYLGYSYCCWANWTPAERIDRNLHSVSPSKFSLSKFPSRLFFSAFETLPLASQNTFARLQIQTVRLAVPGCSAVSVFSCLRVFPEHVTNHPSARKSLANAVVSVSQHVGDRVRADSRAHVCIQRCLHSVYTLRLLMRGADVHFLTRHACNTNEDGPLDENT